MRFSRWGVRPNSPRRALAVALAVAALVAVVAPVPTRATESEPLGHLSGLVEDAKGVVLPGATLALTDAAGQTVATVVGGKDGRYELAVPPGTYTLVADARSGGTPVHVTVGSVTVGAATPLDVVIAGRPGGLVQFRGRLLDSSGSPIGGATIGLEGDASTVTDPEGHFALGVPPGVYPLTIVPAGPPYLHVPGFDLTRDRIGDLRVALVTHDVTVRDAFGAPVERAWVNVHPADPDEGASADDVLAGRADGDWSDSRSTDASGHVHLRGLATSNLRVDVNPPGQYSDSERVSKSGIDGRQSTTLTLTIPAPPSPALIRLSGTTTATDGVTPAYPSITLSGANGTKTYQSQRDYAAGDSAFTLDAPAGTYTLTWSTSTGLGEDWEGGDPTSDYYNLSSQQFHHDSARQVAFRLPAGPGVTVRVLDPDGAPVAGAVVTARSSAPAGSTDFELAPGLRGAGTLDTTRVTGADGVAPLAILPGHLPSSVHVVAPSDRGLDGDFAVPAAATALDVHLDRGVVVSGRIRVGSHPGSPAYHVALGRRLNVAADGTYRVNVVPGTYEVETDNDDDEPGGESDDHWSSSTSSSSFTVTGDHALDLTFPEPSGASVRFVGADGLPLEGELSLASVSARAFTLAPGITATASAWFSAFGARDGDGIDTWPGGAIVSGALDSSMALEFSGVHLMPGGAAVVALAQGYSLARPDPPSAITAVAGSDGSATISWDQSANGHGNPILGHYIQLYGDDQHSVVVPAPATCLTVTGLHPSVRYSVSVSAMTLRGFGEGGYGDGLVIPDAGAPKSGSP